MENETSKPEPLLYKEPELGKLALALSKAQGEMEAAKKDSANPFFKSSYADLASVWEAIRAPLSKNEIAVIQTIVPNETIAIVKTVLIHSSNQKITSEIRLKPVKLDPQGMGSAFTYARRYALMAIVGIAPDEDDGNAASGKQNKQAPPKQNKQPPAPPKPPKNPEGNISMAQIKRLMTIATAYKVKHEEVSKIILELTGKESSKLLTKGEYDNVVNRVQESGTKPEGG